MKITVYNSVGDGFYEMLYSKVFRNPLTSAIKFTEDHDVKGKIKSFVKRQHEEEGEKKPVVYFTREITPEAVLSIYNSVGRELTGNVAVKIHSGEPGNQNFIGPELWRSVVEAVDGTVVECNTAYGGPRSNAAEHYEAMKAHGWSDAFRVDILDGDSPDMELEVKNGEFLTKNYVGGNLANYDSLLVLSHFKGHPMGGFGGALKQLSIGIASSFGKAVIHGAGDPAQIWSADHDSFLKSMAEAAGSVTERFGDKVVYISVMKNMSVDCDCCAVAEDPCMADIGILASTDPVALDQACLDLVYEATDDPGQAHLIERIESRNGQLTVERAAELGIGSRDYVLCEY